jgi:hypothetical protein
MILTDIQINAMLWLVEPHDERICPVQVTGFHVGFDNTVVVRRIGDKLPTTPALVSECWLCETEREAAQALEDTGSMARNAGSDIIRALQERDAPAVEAYDFRKPTSHFGRGLRKPVRKAGRLYVVTV